MGIKVDNDQYFRCLSKTRYVSLKIATKQSYALTELRRSEYEPYICPYCGYYHIGRVNRIRRPESKTQL
jgi:predicted RNA-binding Zn-ribbon protein involved in translation (DUF1610 family)